MLGSILGLAPLSNLSQNSPRINGIEVGRGGDEISQIWNERLRVVNPMPKEYCVVYKWRGTINFPERITSKDGPAM